MSRCGVVYLFATDSLLSVLSRVHAWTVTRHLTQSPHSRASSHLYLRIHTPHVNHKHYANEAVVTKHILHIFHTTLHFMWNVLLFALIVKDSRQSKVDFDVEFMNPGWEWQNVSVTPAL